MQSEAADIDLSSLLQLPPEHYREASRHLLTTKNGIDQSAKIVAPLTEHTDNDIHW